MFRVLVIALALALPSPLAAQEVHFNVVEESVTFRKIDIVSASAVDVDGFWSIRIELTPPAAAKFAELTARNVRKRMQIVIGDRIASSATIMGPITRGEIMLQGHFSEAEAREFAAKIK